MKKSGFTLIELMISITILAVVATLSSRAIIRTMGAWQTASKEVSWNQQLQMGVTSVSQDLMKAKLDKLVITPTTTYDKVKFQIPVQYTQTGAEDRLGKDYLNYTAEYIVETMNNQPTLVRNLYNASAQLVEKRNVAWVIDDQLDTTKSGLDAWKQKGFALLLTNRQLYIYLRVKNINPKPGDTKRHLELETKVYIRN